VHQLTGVGSEAGVRNVLTRLVRQGIVHASPAGSAVLYSVNREHIAWSAVQALAGLRGELFSRLRRALSDWDPRPRTAALFGSVARGDGDADSDIDLLLIRQRRTAADNEAWQGQVSLLREDVMAWTGNTCQVYDIGSDDLERHIAVHDPLVTAWRADAITVYGTDLRGVLRDLGHRVTV
jgi:predicted nucleotidyltransferase